MKVRETMRVPSALAGERLDAVLEALFDGLSRAQAQKAVRRGEVRVDGRKVARSNWRVDGGAVVEVTREAPAAEVLRETEDYVVAIKPAGWITHHADRSDAPDLAAHLDGRFGPLAGARGDDRPGVVHRLDRATSGVLVFARTDAALQALQDQFRARTVDKRYLALVTGVPREDALRLDAPIGPVAGTVDRQGVDHADGKDALTEVRVLGRAEGHALVECDLHTGRRHQIRVHLAEAGHPVVGDDLYGTKQQRALPRRAPAPPRLCLHAWRLAFDEPTGGARVSFEAPVPRDIGATLEGLGLAVPAGSGG